MNFHRFALMITLLLVFTPLAQGQNIMYVKDNATGANDGSSWANAYTNLNGALNQARATSFQGEIWVARALNNGMSYVPDRVGQDRTVSFRLIDGVSLYGGFVGNETARNQRNPDIYITVLTGDNQLDDETTPHGLQNNAYHVVDGSGCSDTAVLDGFRIFHGYADGSATYQDMGGGLYCNNGSPTIRNCDFYYNWAKTSGGAVYSHNNSSPDFWNCTFRNNGEQTGDWTAMDHGAAIFASDSDSDIVDCYFYENKSDTGAACHFTEGSNGRILNCFFYGNEAPERGGTCFFHGGMVELHNCAFSGNISGIDGGAIHYLDGQMVMRNCTLSANSARTGQGGGVCQRGSNLSQFSNTIFWGNSDSGSTTLEMQVYTSLGSSNQFSNCHIEGGNDATHMANVDPLFVDADGVDNTYGTMDDDLQLTATSPCIDTGDNSELERDFLDLDEDGDYYEYMSLDLISNVRLFDYSQISGSEPIVDRGAYEAIPSGCSTCPFRIFVDRDATGGANDGSSWSNAFLVLGDALAYAADPSCCYNVKEIWVAEGTYIPGKSMTILTRDDTFQLVDYCTVYGGFDGTETQLSQRDYVNNKTILSGDQDQNDNGSTANYADNKYHVVTGSGTGQDAVLDGFTIQDGYADVANGFRDRGAGMICDNGAPTIRNCRFDSLISKGSGGAVYLRNNSYPTFDNCLFYDNRSGGLGGAVFDEDSAPSFVKCRFEYNMIFTSGSHGGAIHSVNSYTNLRFYNCLFYGNHANTSGGAIYANGSMMDFVNCVFQGQHCNDTGSVMVNNDGYIFMTNCTLSNNYAYVRCGGIYNTGTSPVLLITNSVLWDNCHDFCATTRTETSQIDGPLAAVTINHSCVQGWTGSLGGTGNIGGNPVLLSSLGKDIGIGCSSSAIDAGDSLVLPADVFDLDNDGDTAEPIPVDYFGNPRRVDTPSVSDTGNGPPPVVDMGAVEFDSPPSCPTRLYVKSTAFGMETGESWNDAYRSLSQALMRAAACCGTVTEIWVAKGDYYPDDYAYDRNISFQLVEGVTAYGGFAGNETQLTQRDYVNNVTVLNGDLNQDDLSAGKYTDNSYHVVSAQYVDNTAVLDGFYIENGYADGTSGNQGSGPGIFIYDADPVIRNCFFNNHYAASQGGTVLVANNGEPRFEDCNFVNGSSDSHGGAFFCQDSTPSFIDCTFTQCQSKEYGGAVHLVNCGNNTRLTNCVFAYNSADNGAGAVYLNGTAGTLTNCEITRCDSASNGGAVIVNNCAPTIANSVIYENQADNFCGGIHSAGNATPSIANSIVWANYHGTGTPNPTEDSQISNTNGTPAVNYCCVHFWSGALGGTGNIGADPRLRMPSNLDFYLEANSPCIDAANNDAVPADLNDLDGNGNTSEPIPIDMKGNPRFVDEPAVADSGNGTPPIVDMGSQEYQPGSGSPTATWTPSNTSPAPSVTPTPLPTDTPVPGQTASPTATTGGPPTATETETQPGAPTATLTPTGSSVADTPTATFTSGPPPTGSATPTCPPLTAPQPFEPADLGTNVDVNPLFFWNDGNQGGQVLWDTTHGVDQAMEPAGVFSDMANLMQNNGWPVTTSNAGVTTLSLSNYRVVIIGVGSTHTSPYTTAEIDVLREYVRGGGNLIMLGDDSGWNNSNINGLAGEFGVSFGQGDLMDPVITNFNPHPIIADVTQVEMFGAGSLAVNPPSDLLGQTTANQPVMAACTLDYGKAVLIGDQHLWSNPHLTTASNLVLLGGVLRWFMEPMAHCQVTYDLLLDTANPPINVVGTGLTIPEFGVSGLTACTTYYWQVIAHGMGSSASGPVWSFETGGCGAITPTETQPGGVTNTPVPTETSPSGETPTLTETQPGLVTATPTPSGVVPVNTPTVTETGLPGETATPVPTTPPVATATPTEPQGWFVEFEMACQEPLSGGEFGFVLVPKIEIPTCGPIPSASRLVECFVSCHSCTGQPCPNGRDCLINQITGCINGFGNGWSVNEIDPGVLRIEGPQPFDIWIQSPEFLLPPDEGYLVRPECPLANLCDGTDQNERDPHPYQQGYGLFVINEPGWCELPREDYDFNKDGKINAVDLIMLLQAIKTGNPPIDITCDGQTNIQDLIRFCQYWQD